MGRQLKVFLPIQKDALFPVLLLFCWGLFMRVKNVQHKKEYIFSSLKFLSFELTYFNPSFIKFVLLVYGKP